MVTPTEFRAGTLRDISYILSDLRTADVEELGATQGPIDPARFAEQIMATCELNLVLWHHGQPVAWLGGSRPREHHFHMGFFATDRWAGPAVVYATRWVQKRLVAFLLDLGIRRAWAESIEGHDNAHRWLRLLGATDEGTLTDWGRHGETFRLFAWRRSDFDKESERVLSRVDVAA